MATYPSIASAPAIGLQPMIRSLSKYDYTAFSIPQSSDEIHPRFTKLIRSQSAAVLSAENIFSLQLKCIITNYPDQCQPMPIRDCSAWRFIGNQLRNLDREFEIIPLQDTSRTEALVALLHKAYASVDTDRLIPVTNVRTVETPWAAARHVSRLYYFDWETQDKSIPMLLDFFHAVVQCNVVSYQCSNFAQVKKTVDRILSLKETQRIVDKFSIDVDLHFKLYLLFATSYYLRIYIENYFPRDIIHRFITIWHDGLSTVP